jgi:hypothetical protein
MSVCSATTSVARPRWESNAKYVTGLSDVEMAVYVITNQQANLSGPRLKEDWLSGRCYWVLFEAQLDPEQLILYQSSAFRERLQYVIHNMWPLLKSWSVAVCVEGVLIVKIVSPAPVLKN